MNGVRGYVLPFVLATVALGVLLGLRPLSIETIAAGYAIALGGIALAALAAAMREAQRTPGSRFEQELTRERLPPSRPTELVRIERELTLAMASAGHVHERFRPLLRAIAEARLGRDLTRERLGDETWELVRPDAPAPQDRAAPGLPMRAIRRMIESLERV